MERAWRVVRGTIEASEAALTHGIAMNLAGATHHAFPDRGEGFCTFNDVAVAVRRLFAVAGDTVAVALAAFISLKVSALLVALLLGIQPAIARREDGTPLFFPLGPEITVPAVLLPHLLIGIGEAALTVFVWRHARRKGWVSA